MFIDRLLDKITHVPPEYEKEIESKQQLIDDLKSSVVFNIDNVIDYLNTCNSPSLIDIKHYPNVMSPFPLVFFEYKTMEEVKRVAKELNQQEPVKMALFVRLRGYQEGNPVYFVNNFEELNDGSFGLRINTFTYSCDKKGELLKVGVLNKLNRENEPTVIYSLAPVLLALSFLHCKNVTIHSEEPAIKLQKARERRGKLPLFTFKTLEIKPMVKILKEQGESETKGLKHALHICRGHFKDFSNGPGLGRGHAHGLYWWESHVRGSREVGAVIKDYKVSPNKESH